MNSAAQNSNMVKADGMQAWAETIGAPAQMAMGSTDPAGDLARVLGGTKKVLVEQKLNLLEALSNGMCDLNNQYKITNEQGMAILHATIWRTRPIVHDAAVAQTTRPNFTLLMLPRRGLFTPSNGQECSFHAR